MLQRIRELAVEAANSTVGTADASSINAEVTSLQAEINRIAQKTTFNGQSLLTGTMAVSQNNATSTAKVGTALATGAAASISAIDVSGAKASTTYTLSSAGGAGTLTLADGLGNSQQVTLDATIGADGTSTINFGTLGVSLTVVGAAGKTGANMSTDLATLTVATGGSTGAVFQIGANEGDNLAVGFANAQTAAYTGFDAAITAFTSGLNSTTAGALITATDTAIASVSSIRGGYGAVENRLSHTVASISVASENLNASESRIKDLDVASEMVNFTKTQILQQAGTSILAQANSAPQSILTLLR
jgi:flagellin